MELTSEQVHWIAGGVFVAGGIILLLRATAVLIGRWIDYVIPAGLALFGIEAFVDPLLHGAAMPSNYAAEMTQHFVMSGLLLVAAISEFLRVSRRATSLAWRLPLGIALALIAGVFALHAQHDSQASMLLLVTQHRMIAATLAAALSVFIVAPDGETNNRRSLGLPLLILVLGTQFLIYTEASGMAPGAGH